MTFRHRCKVKEARHERLHAMISFLGHSRKGKAAATEGPTAAEVGRVASRRGDPKGCV